MAEDTEYQAAEPSEGQQLAARGAQVDLGGTLVRVRFDNLALIELEDQWGSLKAFGQELTKGADGKMYKAVTSAIRACVRDLPVDPAELIDVTRLDEYIEAIALAASESGLIGAHRGNGSGPRTGRTRGSRSTTSPSSRLGSARKRSGR